MSDTIYADRVVTGPSGESYDLSTQIQLDGGVAASEYLVSLAVDDPSDNWDMGSGRRSYTARLVVEDDAADTPRQDGLRSIGCSFTPVVPESQSRVAIAVDVYRVGNLNAHLTDDRRLSQIVVVLPRMQPILAALSIADSGPTEELLAVARRVIDLYRNAYRCSSQSAYATWVYDAALVLDDKTHAAFVNAMEAASDAVTGVTPGVLSASDVADAERIAPVDGERDSAWLCEDGFVRLDFAERDQSHTPTEGRGGSGGTSGGAEDVRDWRFRRRVLHRYGTACAVCGLDIETPDGRDEVDAAHAYARGDGGPDEVENGLPLCSLHHWAYDNGWLAISDDYEVLVADAPNADGYERFAQLHGQPLQLESDERPARRYLRKHREDHGFDAASDDSSTRVTATTKEEDTVHME